MPPDMSTTVHTSETDALSRLIKKKQYCSYFSTTVSKKKTLLIITTGMTARLPKAVKIIAGVILSFIISNNHEKTKTNNQFILTRQGELI